MQDLGGISMLGWFGIAMIGLLALALILTFLLKKKSPLCCNQIKYIVFGESEVYGNLEHLPLIRVQKDDEECEEEEGFFVENEKKERGFESFI